MRIASWNVDSIRARLHLVLDWMDRHEPDVVCLQETKVAQRRFPRVDLEQRGYDLAVTESDGSGGVAMLSRVGLENVVIGIPGAVAPLNQPRSISARCGGLRIHTLYGPNGRKVGTQHHAIKLAWLSLFRTWVDLDGMQAAAPTVVIGDFNVAPADVDIWEPSRYRKRNLTSPPERAAFEAFLDLGLVDVVRRCNPTEPAFTWWNRRSDFYETDRGWRLDHALVDAVTADRVRAAWVDRDERAKEGSSDHAPVVLDLDLGH